MRLVLAGVFVVSLLALIVAAFKPYGQTPSAVYPLQRLSGDASSGTIERIEEGPDYTRVFLSTGDDNYVVSPDNLDATLRAGTGDPPPVKQVNDDRQIIMIVLVISFAGILISGITLLLDVLRGRRARPLLPTPEDAGA